MKKDDHTMLGPGRVALIAFAILVAGAGALKAQVEDLPQRVRGLNDSLLQLHGRTRQANLATVRGLRGEASAILRTRAVAMAELIEKNPKEALALALSSDAAAEMAAAFPEAASLLETQGEWEGTTRYRVFDDENLRTSRTSVRLETAQGALDLYFAGGEPPALACGDRLKVKGVKLGAHVATATTAAITATASSCVPTGVQKAVVLLVTFPGVAAPNISLQTVRDEFFGTSSNRSVNNFWKEASYGKTTLTGDVFGWYTLDQVYTCDQPDAMLAASIRAADSSVNFQNYTRVYTIFPSPGSCSYAGLSDVGCASYSSPNDGTFSASASWMLAGNFSTNDQGVKLAIHEGGHGLGLMHSRSRDFGSAALGALGAGGTISEYGDINSTMGSWNFGHYTAEQKVKLGWLSGANVSTVQSPGSFTVLPTEIAAAGTQALQVQRGTGNNAWLWLEYRQPVGNYDSTLNSQIFSGATVHYHDSVTGTYTDLLDYSTGTSSFADPALAAGNTWVDPYTNVSLTVNSASSNGVNVSVNYGALSCVTTAPSISASPTNPSGNAGTDVSYTVSVTNKDSAGCTASGFSLSSTQPQGWNTTFSSSLLMLSPGQSVSVTMTKGVPAGTAPGTYAVNAVATDSATSGSATANLTVLAPPPPISVIVSSSASSYSSRDTATMTAAVLSGSSPAVGASVRFTMKEPDGSTTSKNATTDSTGKAVWSYKFSPKDAKGTYSVATQATYGTQAATSMATTFSLQ